MRPFGAGRNAAGLDHVAKQAEIGEVETHGLVPVRQGLPEVGGSFGFSEGKLREIPIVRLVPGRHIRH
jgi:hypothetical protein